MDGYMEIGFGGFVNVIELTLTVPISSAGASTPVGSAVLWDTAKSKAMFADIARGDTSDLDRYAK
jgi:hypothetical protein